MRTTKRIYIWLSNVIPTYLVLYFTLTSLYYTHWQAVGLCSVACFVYAELQDSLYLIREELK